MNLAGLKNHCSENTAYQLGIVTPILRMDDHACQLAATLERLREIGCEFTHLVVHATNESSLRGAFKNAELLQERENTKGVYDALRQGFDRLIQRGMTHLSWINADDLLEDGFGDVMRISRRFPKEIVSGRVQWIGEKGQSFGQVPQWRYRWGMRELFARNIPPFTQQGMIFPKDAWISLAGFDSGYELIADSVFWDKALKSGFEVRFSPALSASYRIRKGQLSGNQAKANKEFADWLRGKTDRHDNGGYTALITLLFRLKNSPIYLKRFLRKQKMITSKAIEQGSFH